MTSRGHRIAQAARSMVGVPFRPQGRDPAYGLDCVGLAAAALAKEGIRADLPRGYPQRGGVAGEIIARIDALGLTPLEAGTAGEGDLLLMLAGPAQYHLAIRTAGGFVHADAGLRRVVETPGEPRWPVLRAWFAAGEEG